MKKQNLSYLKGDCSPKVTPKATHPWRRPVFPQAAKRGAYVINQARIEERRAAQLALERALRDTQPV